MNANLRQISLVFAWVIFVSAGQLSAQQKAVDVWDVLGSYSCSKWGVDAPPEKLFLLPNKKWTRDAPFAPSFSHLEWVSVHQRGLSFMLPYIFPDGIYTVESGDVKLYKVGPIEYLEDMRSLRPRFHLLKFDRPSALPPEKTTQSMELIKSFSFDQTSGRLTEILPVDSLEQPFRCQQMPLFTEDSFWPAR